MIDLFYAPTPNGHKITILLEELGLPYRIIPINIRRNDQFLPSFLAAAPNNRIPAIVDHDFPGGTLRLMESGAILTVEAELHGRFLPAAGHARAQVLQWLNWQMGGLGPMAGQNHHFGQFAAEKIPYAIKRYVDETARLYGVLERQLTGKDYVAGEYSIADMAIYPWVLLHERQQMNMAQFPNIVAYLARMGARPAVQRAYAHGAAFDWEASLDEARLQTLLDA
ncbi:MAG: glutathione S-transferase [Candidatus Dactylopiibacterium carminicum]|uniref:Glutathione S-transferase n=1 Tax=Candidatus Dactylopiibacterium carminicum TaxID=857335 RepID=A0A272EUE9_9RHOO|nr:glutathione binding-like protein [Candidatus Dactylopiibacterium carminicum]KAF7599769.1 glutathione S-transferase [Candidatus Dactylopiibacterium carminicum]PAS93723.1 MAG: glutathione S-transferase [Candidatus Dactylopiibacterium carminicum]PAS98276.1 MAG: glutathione S-transferase [Candidatus Dactylopiibacterium carminicum]PAS99770.1 MAG: glutathione S-transferase [Candidatus Dactylopiibacterium carminicum]